MSLAKVLGISLIGGFLSLVFMILFPSILTYNLQLTNWNTSTMILEIAMVVIVIGLGALYVRTQGQFQRRFNIRKSVTVKLARNVILALIAGLIITFLEDGPLSVFLAGPPNGGNTIGVSMVETGRIFSGLALILQNSFTELVQSPLVFFFTASFVVIILFDILWTRERKRSATPRLNNPQTLR